MSEATSGLQEIIEVAGVNSLEARTHAMPGYLGLGPPDLCRLTKVMWLYYTAWRAGLTDTEE